MRRRRDWNILSRQDRSVRARCDDALGPVRFLEQRQVDLGGAALGGCRLGLNFYLYDALQVSASRDAAGAFTNLVPVLTICLNVR